MFSTNTIAVHSHEAAGATINYNNHSTDSLFHNVFPLHHRANKFFMLNKKCFTSFRLHRTHRVFYWTLETQWKFSIQIFPRVRAGIGECFSGILELKNREIAQEASNSYCESFLGMYNVRTLLPPSGESSNLQETLWVLVPLAEFQDEACQTNTTMQMKSISDAMKNILRVVNN